MNDKLERTREVLRLQILFLKGAVCIKHEEDEKRLGNISSRYEQNYQRISWQNIFEQDLTDIPTSYKLFLDIYKCIPVQNVPAQGLEKFLFYCRVLRRIFGPKKDGVT